MAHCSDRIGEAYFRTPRNTVTAFVNMLSVLEQNPGTQWEDLIEEVTIATDSGDDLSDITDAGASGAATGAEDSSDDLSSFKL